MKQAFYDAWTARARREQATTGDGPDTGGGDPNTAFTVGVEHLVEVDEQVTLEPGDEELPGLEPDTGDEDLPGLEPDTGDPAPTPIADEEWGPVTHDVNVTLPDGRIATVHDVDGLGDGDDAAISVFPPPPADPEASPAPPEVTVRGSRGCLAGMIAGVVILLVGGLIGFGILGGGSDDGATSGLSSGSSESATSGVSTDAVEDTSSSPSGTTGEAAATEPGSRCPAFVDQPLEFESPGMGEVLPEAYTRYPTKTDFPTPPFRWGPVPDGVDGLGIALIRLRAEPADRLVDPWSQRERVDKRLDGETEWVVSGIDPETSELPASSLSEPLPAGVIEHINGGTQAVLPDGTLTDRALVGAGESDYSWDGPFLFTLFAYCNLEAEATAQGVDLVDLSNAEVWMAKRSVARGWFYVDLPWG
ncbi:MAG: hypothetical protein D6683_13800 [Actinomyces sp.]|nr:MAG: hypothetical protein D6683_13800 [Actinomyces sp.]